MEGYESHNNNGNMFGKKNDVVLPSTGDAIPIFHMGSYKQSSKKCVKIKRRSTAGGDLVSKAGTINSDHASLFFDRDSSSKRKSDDMELLWANVTGN